MTALADNQFSGYGCDYIKLIRSSVRSSCSSMALPPDPNGLPWTPRADHSGCRREGVSLFRSRDRVRDDLLTTRPAAAIFFLSTLLMPITTAQMFGLVDPSRIPVWGRVPWGIVCMAGTVGLFVLWFGMWLYWVRLDDSKRFFKKIWFVILLLGSGGGACIYYYSVYLPQVFREWKQRT